MSSATGSGGKGGGKSGGTRRSGTKKGATKVQAARPGSRKGRASAKAPGDPDISLVIPVYNEQGLLYAKVAELHERLKGLGWSYELILAENGSTDRTREIGAELSSHYPEVRMMHTPEPNYGLALRRGIEAARGTWVICDEIDICDVGFHQRAMSVLCADQCDMVIGSKLHADAMDRRPMIRHAGTVGINLLLKLLLGFKGTDTHGLKAFHRERLLPVVRACLVDRDLFASELVIRSERARLRILEIPVEIVEKRPPSINLFRRVPNVLRNLYRLTAAIRFGKEV